MDEISKLRQQIAKARRNATAKAARIKRTTGAVVSGSEFDPRRTPGVEKRYNTSQAKAYLRDLQNFNARNVQFVPGSKGAPLPRHRWNFAMQRAQQVEMAARAHESSMGNIPAASGDMTIAQAKAMRPNSNVPRPGVNQVVSGPYTRFNKESTDIASARGLEKLITDLGKKLNPNYLPQKIKQGRENLIKALEIMGEQEWQNQVESLTDFQFDALWFGSPTAIEAVFAKYELEQKRAAGSSKEAWQDRVIDRASDEFGEFLEWASTEVPTDRPKTQSANTQSKRPKNRKIR